MQWSNHSRVVGSASTVLGLFTRHDLWVTSGAVIHRPHDHDHSLPFLLCFQAIGGRTFCKSFKC